MPNVTVPAAPIRELAKSRLEQLYTRRIHCCRQYVRWRYYWLYWLGHRAWNVFLSWLPFLRAKPIMNFDSYFSHEHAPFVPTDSIWSPGSWEYIWSLPSMAISIELGDITYIILKTELLNHPSLVTLNETECRLLGLDINHIPDVVWSCGTSVLDGVLKLK